MNIEKAFQVGSDAMQFIAARPPRFPRASVWAGELADFSWRGCRWMGIPLGPFKRVLAVMAFRASLVRFFSRPFHERLVVGSLVGLLSGLEAFVGDLAKGKPLSSDDSGSDELRDLREEILGDLNGKGKHADAGQRPTDHV